MRKKLTIMLVLLLAISGVSYASNWRYVFDSWNQHPEILEGLVPTHAIMGGGYDGLSFIEGNQTELQLLLGLGYSQRKIWQDPTDGSVIIDDPLIHDVFQGDTKIRLSQGFLHSPVPSKDLWTAYIGVENTMEIYKDSMVVGSTRQNGTATHAVSSIADWFSSYGVSPSNNAYYPDFGANGSSMLKTTLVAGLTLDMMDDKIVTQDGLVSDLSLNYGPSVLNSLLDGTASFYSITSNTEMAKTLYSLKTGKTNNVFSIVLADRFNVNWTDGSAVPLSVQGPVSLGNKVRGYASWTYNTQFTVVNNLDIRICGPEPRFQGFFPKVTLFLDLGYGAGNYFNTTVSSSNFLASTGVQGTLALFSSLTLGYQVAYLFTNDNYVYHGNPIVGSVVMALHF